MDLSSWVLTLAAGSDLVLLRGQGRGEAGMGREGKERKEKERLKIQEEKVEFKK